MLIIFVNDHINISMLCCTFLETEEVEIRDAVLVADGDNEIGQVTLILFSINPFI